MATLQQGIYIFVNYFNFSSLDLNYFYVDQNGQL